MYIVPQSRPAPSAAQMPSVAAPCGPDCDWCDVVAYARTHAPTTIAAAPPSTLAHWLAPAPRSSLKSSQPHNSPTRLLVFHNGNAIERPTLRMAKTVSVLATAQSIP